MEEFEVGDIVIHKLHSSIGEGKIIKIHEDKFLTVDFEHYTGYSYVGTKPRHGWYSHHSNFKLVRKEDERKEKENIRWYRNGKLVKSFENFINESNINDFHVGQRVMAEDPNGRMRKGVILIKHFNDSPYIGYIGVKFDDYDYNCHNLDGACEEGYGYWVHFKDIKSLEEEEKTLKIKWFRDGKLTKENFREEIDPYSEEEWGEEEIKIGDRVIVHTGKLKNKKGTIYDYFVGEHVEAFLIYFDKRIWNGYERLYGKVLNAEKHGIPEDNAAWVEKKFLKKIL
jgi:hypothetical protein